MVKGQVSALVFSTVAMIISFAVWSVIAPIATTIQDLYELSEVEKSLLVVTPVILGSLMRIPMGIMTDRFGGKKVYTLTMLFLILPLIGAGFADSYFMLLLCTFFIGMGGATFAIAVTYVTRWFPPEKQGLVLGIAGIGNLGTAVASFTVPTIFSHFGLNWVFWGLAIAIGIMAIIFSLGTKELQRPKEIKTFKESLIVLKDKQTWILSLFYFLTFGGFVAFSLYLPIILQETFQLSAVSAGWKVSIFVIVATLIRPIGGYCADKFGSQQVLTWLFIGMMICSILMAFANESFILFSISCLVIASLLGAGNGAVFKLVPQVSPNNTGAVTGFVSAIGGIGGFFPPMVLGVIKSFTGDYSLGFLLLSLFSLLCLLVINWSYSSHVINPLRLIFQKN
ncbi:MFS transporter [Aquibacillus albus]|uniref:NNP family nitrate/nitrite transporter-like MFS transporter n=1 Tax=Aquibacillus albus TaxID=1168171 RepID=A0ABS2N3W5_9BACI|nr:nitrate/nitrite transporter [Aquibacillus albus]MBM7572811.1 NNP family nitrate/nitrite transporter-like MFS transporter [Aquibacillus albus]